jgi:hypothetical protein
MIRVPAQHALEHRDQFQRVSLWLAVRRPELPRTQVHHRIRVHRRDFRIVREAMMDIGHRFAVLAVERLRIRRWIE